MDQKPPTPEIEALIRRADSARGHIGCGIGELRARLDTPARLRASLLEHPMAWIGGTAAGGLLLTRMVFRKRLRKSSGFFRFGGLTGHIVRLLLSAATPVLKVWLLARINDHLARKTSFPTKPQIHR